MKKERPNALESKSLYKAYWVAQCRYTRNSEQFKGVMTVAGTSQPQAIKQMRQYFTAHPGEYTFADYDINPFNHPY